MQGQGVQPTERYSGLLRISQIGPDGRLYTDRGLYPQEDGYLRGEPRQVDNTDNPNVANPILQQRFENRIGGLSANRRRTAYVQHTIRGNNFDYDFDTPATSFQSRSAYAAIRDEGNNIFHIVNVFKYESVDLILSDLLNHSSLSSRLIFNSFWRYVPAPLKRHLTTVEQYVLNNEGNGNHANAGRLFIQFESKLEKGGVNEEVEVDGVNAGDLPEFVGHDNRAVGRELRGEARLSSPYWELSGGTTAADKFFNFDLKLQNHIEDLCSNYNTKVWLHVVTDDIERYVNWRFMNRRVVPNPGNGDGDGDAAPAAPAGVGPRDQNFARRYARDGFAMNFEFDQVRLNQLLNRMGFTFTIGVKFIYVPYRVVEGAVEDLDARIGNYRNAQLDIQEATGARDYFMNERDEIERERDDYLLQQGNPRYPNFRQARRLRGYQDRMIESRERMQVRVEEIEQKQADMRRFKNFINPLATPGGDDLNVVGQADAGPYIGCFRPPTTPGDRAILKLLSSKRSVGLVKNTDNTCFFRALALCLVKGLNQEYGIVVDTDTRDVLETCGFLALCRPPHALSMKHASQYVTRGSSLLTKFVGVLYKVCGLTYNDKVSVSDIKRVEDVLKLHIRVYDACTMFNKVYDGNSEMLTKVYLILHGAHTHALFSRKGLLKYSYECKKCDVVFNNRRDHARCPDMCFMCRERPCRGAEEDRCDTPCDTCNRVFRNALCFEAHKELNANGTKALCGMMVSCGELKCSLFNPSDYLINQPHRCGDSKCRNCGVMSQRGDHSCPIQVIKPDEPSDKLLFFDFECSQETGVHQVTHVVAQGMSGEEYVFAPDDMGDFTSVCHDFCTWLMGAEFKDFTVIAHNGQGYDFHFILRWALRRGITPKNVIMTGQKIKQMKIGRVRFIDSLSFLTMPLSSFPKTFGLEEAAKGYFPHLFNTRANQNYVGGLPDPEMYMADSMVTKARVKFLEWWGEHRDDQFDFRSEILRYCSSDVDILRRGCIQFRDLFLETTGVDPFSKVTIAAACLQVFKSSFMTPNSIYPLGISTAAWVRRAFHGGRTCVFQAHVDTRDTPGMTIDYVDVTSLYPYVNSSCEYPFGRGETVKLDPPTEDPDEIMHIVSHVFGFVECDVVCPPDLLHPILPSYHNNRLVFDLTPKTRRVFTSPELWKAVDDKGYRVTKIYRFMHWSKQCTGIFKDYMLKFLKLKQEATGWDGKMLDGVQVSTAEEKAEWVAKYAKEEGVQLDVEKVDYNPGLRAIAKLCMNSLWGKFGQRSNQTKVKYCESMEKVYKVFNKGCEVSSVNEVEGTDMHEVVFKEAENRLVDPDTGGSLDVGESILNFNNCEAIAAFTTCWARLVLYEALDTLQERVIYCDTDSVVYHSMPGEEGIDLGDKLGEWTNEVGLGNSIIEFVAAGPKSYGYLTSDGKAEVKCKGVRLSYSNTAVLNFDSIKRVVLAANYGEFYGAEETEAITTGTSHKIVRDKKSKEIRTEKDVKKVFRSTIHQKGEVDMESKTLRLYPYGYEGPRF